jgi:Dolichyl-phosphate-mannose-protein mannosyltransferase
MSREPEPYVRTWWVVAAIGVLALGLRLWSLGFGLPAIYNMDEKPILDRALTFAKGDPNPHNFLYPTLHLYAVFVWESLYFLTGRLVGHFASLAEFRNAYFVDPSGQVLAARALTALLGALTIGATYLFGSRLYGRAVGVGAAFFMAVAPMAVRDAHYIKLDVPVTFFATLACAELAAIKPAAGFVAGKHRWLLAGGLAGLAISTHYYAAFLAVPFVVVALADAARSRDWRLSVRLLLWGGLATLAAFAATSPFFFLEPNTVVRDFTELRAVDIDRAVNAGYFSSLPAYGWLLLKAVGYPVFLLALAGSTLAVAQDRRRGLLLVSFPLAFLLFVSNTFPASRYLNILLPSAAVAAAYAVSRAARLAGTLATPVMAAICLGAAVPGARDAVGWDQFFAKDDTRTLAQAFIEREIPAGTSIAVQPYSAPIRQSKVGLREALEASLGDVSQAPLKYQLELAAVGYAGPSYRILYIGRSGKTGAPPGDLDKIYISPGAFTGTRGIQSLRQAGVAYAVLTSYGPTPPPLAPLAAALRREGTRVARFSPYQVGIDPMQVPAPPFSHNSNTWLDPRLERPGPIVEIWRVDAR